MLIGTLMLANPAVWFDAIVVVEQLLAALAKRPTDRLQRLTGMLRLTSAPVCLTGPPGPAPVLGTECPPMTLPTMISGTCSEIGEAAPADGPAAAIVTPKPKADPAINTLPKTQRVARFARTMSVNSL